MDGHTLLRRLVSSGARASVILMSGRGELDDAIGALREGAVDYLKKPWRSDDLAAALDRAIALHDAYRELSLPPALTRAVPQQAADPVPAGEAVHATALIERLAAAAARGDLEAPVIPEELAQLRALSRGDDISPDALQALIQRTPALVHALRADARAEAVKAAVDRLGILDTIATLETRLLRESFPMPVPALQTLNDRIWRFSVARALAMRNIAEASELEAPLDRQLCYLAGLWLDAGASFLLSQIAAAMERQGAGIADSNRMMSAVNAHHGRVGAALVSRWGAPPEVVALVRDHHGGSPGTPSAMWCAAALAGAVAVRLTGFGDPTGERDLSSESLARCAYTLGVGDTVLRRLTHSLETEVQQVGNA